ncbi:hypothetical protein [Myxacorys almedinensis]|uniref:hypothetical protein n=1 Tax=Myxacorys almedinensis TaxID=2651157 RepID=UPI00192EBB61|nr:hypothetical protein [Myxacorys almedinensis]
MTQPYQVVVDTNVLIAGLRSKRGASYSKHADLGSDYTQLRRNRKASPSDPSELAKQSQFKDKRL